MTAVIFHIGARRPAAAGVPWLLLGLLLATSACAPTRHLASEPAASRPSYDDVTPAPATSERASASAAVEQRLRSEVEAWRGTPHALGGTDQRGLDCSAFVQRVYASLFDVHLPRTTAEQAKAGRPVRNGLQAGDLVFFKPSEKTNHVGIYLSEGEFAHVSSSRGVTISHLSEAYWRDAYWTSRRILEDPVRPLVHAEPDSRPPSFTPPPPPTVEEERLRRTKSRRVGW